MMRMLGYRLRARACRMAIREREPGSGRGLRRASRGFTLLEMLVVLALIGMLMALVGPAVGSRLDGMSRRYERDVLLQQLQALPRRVRLSGQPAAIKLATGNVVSGGVTVLEVPYGWTIEFTPPLRVSSLGSCAKSAFVARAGDGSENVAGMLSALECSVVVE